jgi:hypothetical protein
MPRLAPLLVVLILTACGSVTPPGAVPTVVPTATGATATRAMVSSMATRAGPPSMTLAYGGTTRAGMLAPVAISYSSSYAGAAPRLATASASRWGHDPTGASRPPARGIGYRAASGAMCGGPGAVITR